MLLPEAWEDGRREPSLLPPGKHLMYLSADKPVITVAEPGDIQDMDMPV